MTPSYLLFALFLVFCGLSSVYGDCYMQNPRGNNDRLNEADQDRDNANRLFNSENNARGGYCWGPELTYYAGSILAIEWTTQHSCGNSNTQCSIILQYMCSSDTPTDDPTQIIRDGTTTNTITTDPNPNNADYYNQRNPDGTFLYGMNEPYSNYAMCLARTRNMGLFAADQAVSTNQGSMATRQDPGGTRYGFECTEERDYYPYWHPSPWKDIAILANSKSQCKYYQSNSQNVMGKNYCNGTSATQLAANNQVDCQKAQGTWVMQPSWGIGKPNCQQALWSRDNHLGNGMNGHTNSYNWTLPTGESCINNGNCTCVLRIRYNITVGELTGNEDSKLNGAAVSPVTENPTVVVEGLNYTLALDTAQTGRTFQDRSFMFRIAKRPSYISSKAKIYNLNVRGKRGNIVQTYPATEYDFVPTFLEVTQGDWVHFQWTGCDTNPANNAGEGRTQTDRSNIVQIASMTNNYPINDTVMSGMSSSKKLFSDDNTRMRMALIDQVNCLSYAQLLAQTDTTPDQNPQNCMVLNQAGPRFSGQPVKMSQSPGSYAYMSTRNNNFSNRSQKGQITIKPLLSAGQIAGIVIGGVAAVAIGAAAGTVFYAHRHPLSKVAELVHKVPGLSRV